MSNHQSTMSRQSSSFLSPRDDNIPPSPVFAAHLASIIAPGSLDPQLHLEISAPDIPLQEYEVEVLGMSIQEIPVLEAAGISLENHEELTDGVSPAGPEQVSNNTPIRNCHLSADAHEAAPLSEVSVTSELPVLSSEPLRFSSKSSVILSPEPQLSITRLPTEIIEKVFAVFIEHSCPLLYSLYETGSIPINSEREGLHANSSLIQRKLQQEHASIRPLLSLSGYFYGIISRLLSHREVYLNGIRSFNQLVLFEQRKVGDFFVIKKPAVIESLFRLEGEPYTPEMRQHRRSLRGSPPGVLPYRSTHPMQNRSYDRTRSGTEWRDCEPGSTWTPEGWDMFPSWLAGGSIEGGMALCGDDADDKRVDPTLMNRIRTLVIGPDGLPPNLVGGNHPLPDMNLIAPKHLMFKVFNNLNAPSTLKNLVISGSILVNSRWLAPKEPGIHPLAHLTRLTLSLSENPSKFDTPLMRLQKYIETSDECHSCNLLTGKNSHDKKTIEVPFLTTLKHLHIRGPGAHVCANLFDADWKALESVVIEMGTHRGVCDGETLGLITAVNSKVLKRPEMAIEITVRVCEPEFERDAFGHHWWRIYPDTVPTLEQSTGTGEEIVLVKKIPGPTPPVFATLAQLDRLNHRIESEWQQAMLAVSKISATAGFDPLAVMYFDNEICKAAEKEERERPDPEDETPRPVVIDDDRMLELRARADRDWLQSGEPLFPRFWEGDNWVI